MLSSEDFFTFKCGIKGNILGLRSGLISIYSVFLFFKITFTFHIIDIVLIIISYLFGNEFYNLIGNVETKNS